jgi:hypothetical protein
MGSSLSAFLMGGIIERDDEVVNKMFTAVQGGK